MYISINGMRILQFVGDDCSWTLYVWWQRLSRAIPYVCILARCRSLV